MVILDTNTMLTQPRQTSKNTTQPHQPLVSLISILTPWETVHQQRTLPTDGNLANHVSTSESTRLSTGNQSVFLPQKKELSLLNQIMVSPSQWSVMPPTSDVKPRTKIMKLSTQHPLNSSNTGVVLMMAVMVISHHHSSHT